MLLEGDSIVNSGSFSYISVTQHCPGSVELRLCHSFFWIASSKTWWVTSWSWQMDERETHALSLLLDWILFPSLKHRNSTAQLVHELQRPFSNCQDYEVLLTRFCALAFGWVKLGQTCLPVTKHPREWQLYLCFSVTLTHTHSLACGQCTDVITDIPGCYFFSSYLWKMPLIDAAINNFV